MPIISRFYGIRIRMFFDDRHGPHFHAIYAEDEAQISILDGTVMSGELPNRALKFVQLWRTQHTAELLENWRRARDSQPLEQIEGLK